MTTEIKHAGVLYQVLDEEGRVLQESLVQFGLDSRHRAGGAAFREAAREQEKRTQLEGDDPMRLTDNHGVIWQVHFHHEHLDPSRSIGVLRSNPMPRQRALVSDITTATIHRARVPGSPEWFPCTVGTGCKGSASEEVEHGEAYCSERDEFKKSVGRKLALAQAMQHHPALGGEYHYGQRRALWLDYLTKMRVIISVPSGAA